MSENKYAYSTVESLHQMSCYDIISTQSPYFKDRFQIEEEDLFKFNCQDIRPDDFVSLQVVTNYENFQDQNTDD